MKQTSKIVMVAAALLAGTSANAWANGTEVPPPAPPPYTPPPAPAPVYKPAPPPVVDDNGPYLSLSGGLNLLNNSTISADDDEVDDAIEYKTGYVINGAIGLKSGDVRLEAEAGYHHNSVDKYLNENDVMVSAEDIDITAWSFMGNVYYDFNMSDSSVTPFIMGGLGMADISVDDNESSESKTEFAWQLGAGIGIKAADNVTVDLSYRYFKTSSPTFDTDSGSGKVSIGGSEILAGIRVAL
jgi:opacity protein-like surface antigen